MKKEVGGSAKVTFPFGASVPPKKVGAGLELGFKLPPLELNLIGAEVDGLNVPIGSTGAFLQGLSGKIQNFAPSNPNPVEFTGGLKLTGGPKIAFDLTAIGLKKFEAALVDLDATVNVNKERIKGNGKFKIIHEEVARSGNLEAEINWNKGFFETKGDFSLINDLITTKGGFKASSNFDITMSGEAIVKIPQGLPLFGGKEAASGYFLFNFTNNGNSSDDFGAGWIKINLGLVSFVGGFKVFFDGKKEFIGPKNLPKTSSFTIAPGTDWILMGADWENDNDNVKVKVKAPDGTIFNESDFAATEKIAIVNELTNSTTRVVIVRNPEPGIWDINAVDDTGLGQVTYSAFRDSIAPTIEITSPLTEVTDQNVIISYNAFDSDSNAKVSLFYDDNNQDFDGILIKGDLDETDGAGSFTWNTKGIANGDYYIYAMIMDENNPSALSSYSTGQVRVTEAADLSITKIANADIVNVGDNLTYIVTVTNDGDSVAEGVKLIDTLPEGVTLLSSNITPTISLDNQLTFNLDDLEKGQTAEVFITITAPTTVPTAGIITNTASVTTETYDSDISNNITTLETTVTETSLIPSDLSYLLLTSNLTDTPINLGDKIHYTLTVTNNGNSKATNVKLIDDIGSLKVKDVSVIASQGTTFIDSDGYVIAELGNLEPGTKATVDITATTVVAGTLNNNVIVFSNESSYSINDNYLTQNKAVIIPSATALQFNENNVFTISGGSGNPKLQVTLTESKSPLVNELAVFTVDDAQGKINGIALGETGYTQAALNKSKVIFSTLANRPNGFNINNLTSILEFESGNNLRFLLVKNGTIDNVKNGNTPTSDILFSDLSRQKITNLGSDGFSLAWKDGSNNNTDFKDLVVNIKSTDDSLPLGTNLQGKQQGEVLDLRGITQDVKADFTVNREAAFNNFVGFYKVADENGGIDIDGNGTVDFRPGESGYAQAAIKNRVAGIDLTVNNQGTASFTDKTLTGGSIFAPFILTNGRTVDQVLNGQVDQAYFAYLGANADKVDHIRLLGNNVFGFEDLAGGGDKDYNDVVLRVNLSVV